MNKNMVAVWITLMFVWTSASAVKVTSLYQVDIPVASQAPDARSEAIRQGFEYVLIRLTGDQNILTNRHIRTSLNRADYYVQEFTYSSPDVSSSTYNLRIKYSEPDVKRLLKRMGMKQWSAIRPLVLVWLATMNDQHQADVLSVETQSGMLEKFKQQGKRYGLPLIFPVMDMTDMRTVSPDSIMNVALPELKAASKRYEPDVLLIGTIERDQDKYEGRFNLVWKDQLLDVTTTATTQEQVISDVLDQVSQVLSRGRVVAERVSTTNTMSD